MKEKALIGKCYGLSASDQWIDGLTMGWIDYPIDRHIKYATNKYLLIFS